MEVTFVEAILLLNQVGDKRVFLGLCIRLSNDCGFEVNMRLPPLQSLRAFDAAARHLNFTRAAEELFVTQGAISQQIRQLEEYLGFRLFFRLPRRLQLTEEGDRLARATFEGFSRIAGEIDSLRAVEEAGVVTVSVLQSFAVKWLVPRLGHFREAHPDIDVRIHADDRLVDFRNEGIDLAVRFGRGRYPNLYTELLMRDEVFPVCSPDYLASSPPLNRPADIAGHQLLHDATSHIEQPRAADWQFWLEGVGVKGIDLRRGLRFNSGDMVIQAALMGHGVGMARTSLAAQDLKAGLLVRPFPQTVASSYAYYLTCPEENLNRPRVQSFIRWLKDEVAATLKDIEENQPALTVITPDPGKS
ncbi:LysR family glycine cleavage system transcriptional activator [Thalassospira sp. 11-3]|jgi:LysR family transcriptional regulator, glycine cleavage system transcriptional activator|nr:transcriptional regulator, LysR family [Thalassospira sp. KO164]PXX31987.1 LysR family glycine cleavage system transcriptional activator [Thalassospira sp. 11-3]SEE75369.1 transcriptional regulator, LysR family [Thalassospira permensis]